MLGKNVANSSISGRIGDGAGRQGLGRLAYAAWRKLRQRSSNVEA